MGMTHRPRMVVAVLAIAMSTPAAALDPSSDPAAPGGPVSDVGAASTDESLDAVLRFTEETDGVRITVVSPLAGRLYHSPDTSTGERTIPSGDLTMSGDFFEFGGKVRIPHYAFLASADASEFRPITTEAITATRIDGNNDQMGIRISVTPGGTTMLKWLDDTLRHGLEPDSASPGDFQTFAGSFESNSIISGVESIVRFTGGSGRPMSLTIITDDLDGVGDEIEDLAENSGDGNYDATPDKRQGNVTSLPSSDSSCQLTLATDVAVQHRNVAAQPTAGDLPSHVDAPCDFIDFQLDRLSDGETVPVELWISPPIADLEGYMAYNHVAGVWEFLDATVSDVNGSTVVAFSVTDGGPYDADGLANGVFEDPSGPVVVTTEPTATFSTVGLAVDEGDGGTTVLNVDISLSAARGVPVTVNVDTVDGTAVADSDYVPQTAAPVLFPPNQTVQAFALELNGDETLEGDETLQLQFDSADGAQTTGPVEVTIRNDDIATVTLTGPRSQPEGNAGPSAFVFTATLDHAVPGGFDLAYSTEDGSATLEDGDYIDNDGTLSFAGNAGEAQTITVQVIGDDLREPNETFSLNFGDFSNLPAAIDAANLLSSGAPLVAIIFDDDTVPAPIPTMNRWALLLLVLTGMLAALCFLRAPARRFKS